MNSTNDISLKPILVFAGGPYGHLGNVKSICVSEDGVHLCSGGTDNTVVLWNIEKKKRLFHHTYHHKSINSVDFSRGLIASGSNDGSAVIWNPRTGGYFHIYGTRHHSLYSLESVGCVKFSRGGKFLVNGINDGSFQIWNVEREHQVRQMMNVQSHGPGLICCEFLWPTTFVTGGIRSEYKGRGCLKIWDLRQKYSSLCVRDIFEQLNEIRCARYLPDSNLLAVGSDDVCFYDIRNWKVLKRMNLTNGFVNEIDFHPLGRFMVVCSTDKSKNILLVDNKTGKIKFSMERAFKRVNSARFSPDMFTPDRNFVVFANSKDVEIRRFSIDPFPFKDLSFNATMICQEQERQQKEREERETKEHREKLRKSVPPVLKLFSEDGFDEKNDRDHYDRLKGSGIDFSSVRLVEYIAGGSFGAVFVCKVRRKGSKPTDKPETLVAKFLNEDFDMDHLDMISREDLGIEYHKNVVSVIEHNSDYEVHKNHPNINELIPKRSEDENPHRFRDGIVIMKHYMWTLRDYISYRAFSGRKDDGVLENREICNILMGILEGVQHLNQNMVCHRDLHPGNIFVVLDPNGLYARVLVGDFGCALNFGKRKGEMGTRMTIRNSDLDRKGFFVVYEDYTNSSFLWNNLGGSYKYSKTPVGGKRVFDVEKDYRAPEILKYGIDPDEHSEIDYSKSDMYAIGRLVEYLLRHRCTNRGSIEEKELGKDLSELRNHMKRTDPDYRISYDKAITDLKKIISDHVKRY